MRPYRISPERLTLRFVILGMGALAVAGIEGLLMRTQLMNMPLLSDEHWYAILTAHPLVGIYGWAYLCVMGAFLYLVPKLLNKPLYSPRLATVTLWMVVGGLALAWSSGFFLHFAALYTVYWPLPVARFPPVMVTMFAVGLALVEIGVLLFVVNIAATVLRRPKEAKSPGAKPTGALLLSAFGIDVAVVYLANRVARWRRREACRRSAIAVSKAGRRSRNSSAVQLASERGTRLSSCTSDSSSRSPISRPRMISLRAKSVPDRSSRGSGSV